MRDALRRCEQAVEHGDRDRDARRNVRAGKKPRLAPMQFDTVLRIQRGEPVEVLIIADAVLDRQLLDI